MTIKNWVFAGIMALAMMMSAGGALGQDEDAPAERDPADNWLKVCEPLESGENACLMRQVVLNNNQFLGSFVLRDDPGQESRLFAVAAVPLGVILPFGMTWQIDGGQPVRVPFMLCDPQSCSAQLVINEAYVSSLKRGAELILTAKNRQNQDLTVRINLAGFTSVYESDESLSFEEANQQESGSTALERVLQDRAEELRRQMGVQEGDEDAADASSEEPAAEDVPAAE